MEQKHTEARTRGRCSAAGWENIRDTRRRETVDMFAKRWGSLFLPACTWTLDLLDFFVWQRAEPTLFVGRVTAACLSVSVLMFSSGHVFESGIIRSELQWATAWGNWLREVTSAKLPTVTALRRKQLAPPHKWRGEDHLSDCFILWAISSAASWQLCLILANRDLFGWMHVRVWRNAVVKEEENTSIQPGEDPKHKNLSCVWDK